MDSFSTAVATPPLALVALLGKAEYHSPVGEHLGAHRPPMNCLGLADPLQAGRLFGERNGTLTSADMAQGIVKVRCS